MADPRSVRYCRWAEPTLFVVHPFWTAAEDCPWSCHADGVPRPVEDTGVCRICGRWLPRADADKPDKEDNDETPNR